MNLPIHNARIRLSSGQIFWREIGRGQALVFLHGSSRDGSQWLSVIKELGQYYHCFAPDLLGFGESEKPPIHHSINGQVDCLKSYLESVNLQHFYLIGHSLGGWIATQYALKYPEQVKGLILFSPEGIAVKGEGKKQFCQVCFSNSLTIFLLRLLLPFSQLLGLKSQFQNILKTNQQLANSPATRQLLFKRRRREIQAELVENLLPSLQIPLLILQGEKDTPENLLRSQTYAKLADKGQLHLISQGNYNLPEEIPEKVAEIIQKFVESF